MSSRSAVIAALAGLAVAVTGCTSAPLMTAVTHSVPTPTPLQLTGTALQSALLPLSDFPPGYAVDTQGSGNTGSSLLSGTPSPTASPQNCQQRVQVAEISPPGATAGVQQVLYDATIDHPSSYHQRRYVQVILQFAVPSGASAYISSLRSVISRCWSMTNMENGTDVYIVGETVFGVRLMTPPSRYAALTAKLIARVDAMG